MPYGTKPQVQGIGKDTDQFSKKSQKKGNTQFIILRDREKERENIEWRDQSKMKVGVLENQIKKVTNQMPL